MAVFCVLALIVLIPLFLPYIQVKKNMKFERNIPTTILYSAKVESYFCTPGLNRIWGNITSGFRRNEGELFVGLIPLVLLFFGMKNKKCMTGQWKYIKRF